MSVDFVNLSMTRRKLIKGAACSAAAASAPSLVNHAFAEQIAKLEKEAKDAERQIKRIKDNISEIEYRISNECVGSNKD